MTTQPGQQIWLFHPVSTEPVNLNNPGPGHIRPRKWRYRPKKQKGAPACYAGAPAKTPVDSTPETKNGA
jgi:hypothetical protein